MMAYQVYISGLLNLYMVYDMIWYVYYGVVLTECGGDDGQLDTTIHHQPHAQAQHQRGNIIAVQNVWFAHA